MSATRRNPRDPFATRDDGEILVVEYVPCGRVLRPHSIVTTTGTYDANWSKASGALLVHESGSGSFIGDSHIIDPHWTYWIANGMKLTRWDRRKNSAVPATARWIAANEVTLLARIRRDPFKDSIGVDGHIAHCSICDDYFNDDDNAPCAHLRWSDDACRPIGPGSDEEREDWLPESVVNVCEHLGAGMAKELRDAIASKQSIFTIALTSALNDINAEPESHGGDGCEPAMLWLDMLDGSKALAPARAAMVRWIDAALKSMANPDTWQRVVFVPGDGYDCDEENTGRAWSDRQKHATRRGKAEAHTRAAEFRANGGDATVIRLCPRALTAGVTS